MIIVGDPQPSSGNKYEATYRISAEGCNEVYAIRQFTLTNPSVSSTSDWLSVTPLTSESGLRIIAQANTSDKERSQTVVVNDANGTLTLTIVQSAPSEEPEEDATEMGYNNMTSSNPAYARRR